MDWLDSLQLGKGCARQHNPKPRRWRENVQLTDFHQTADDSLQPTIDMLLNMTIFLWFGAVCPWLTFRDTPDVPLARVLGLGILIILLRRPPIIMLVHRFVPQIQSFRECLFAGYFGPIGVSAIFYLYVALEFYAGILKNPDLNSVDRERVERAKTAIVPVVWVCVIASVVVHGITVPMIQVCLYVVRNVVPSRIY